jgi:Brp/Blh family beta-carotene 15,15'-monooxygenase
MHRPAFTTVFALVATITGFTTHAYAELFVVGALAAGLSHGAVDHLLSGRRQLGKSAGFYVAYLALIALMGLLWQLTPAGATWTFLLVSAYHFGQSDFLTKKESPEGRPSLWWTRGLLLIVAPLVAWPSQAAWFIGLLIGDSGLLAAQLLHEDIPRWSIPMWLFAIHLGALGAVRLERRRRIKYAIDAGALTLLMILTPPFVSFSVYFVVWHTAQHWKWASARLKVRSVFQLACLAAPMTILAAFGLGALWYVFQPGSGTLLRWSIIGVSALAVPHMVVVEMTTRTTSIERWRNTFGLTASPGA